MSVAAKVNKRRHADALASIKNIQLSICLKSMTKQLRSSRNSKKCRMLTQSLLRKRDSLKSQDSIIKFQKQIWRVEKCKLRELLMTI